MNTTRLLTRGETALLAPPRLAGPLMTRLWLTRLSLACLGLACLCLLPLELRADFGEPVVVTQEGKATNCYLDIDGANNVYIVSIVDSRLRVSLIGPNLNETLPIAEVAAAQGRPTASSTCCGETFIAFDQADPNSATIGREIFMTSNGGGRFKSNTNLSRNAVEDHSPQMALDIFGVPQLVWTQTVLGADRVIHYSHSDGSRKFVADGESPSLAIDEMPKSRTFTKLASPSRSTNITLSGLRSR